MTLHLVYSILGDFTLSLLNVKADFQSGLLDAGSEVLWTLVEEWDDEGQGADGCGIMTLLDEHSEQHNPLLTHVCDSEIEIPKLALAPWKKQNSISVIGFFAYCCLKSQYYQRSYAMAE